ncbi:MAG TPA: DNA-processing protein DprA [bacterium]|nr:DNA-processing protein DprA [bacterium]
MDFFAAGDPRFPAKLNRLADPPTGLYFRGELALLQQAGPWIAVVGTRHATVEALRYCESLIIGLRPCSPVIVSGLAIGIDGMAHRSALNAGLATVAVLGSSLDQIYPPRHRPLARDILSQGLLVSELAPRTPLAPWHFPQRNRLIAALADLLVVVEAPEKSGALITADFALDLGIDIYVVPGRAASPNNRGGHRLIQQGAKLLMDPEEILVDLGLQPPPSSRKTSPAAVSKSAPSLGRLSPEEYNILKIIGFQPAHIDKIAAMSHLATAQVIGLLQGLVLEGWLEEMPGKCFGLHPAHRELLSKT